MTHEQFLRHIESEVARVLELVRRKNEDYSGTSPNPFAAFDEAASVLGLTREQVWAVFYMKHVQALVRFIKTGLLSDEDIHSRLMDLIAYPLILSAMLSEETDAPEEHPSDPANSHQEWGRVRR